MTYDIYVQFIDHTHHLVVRLISCW